MLWRSLAEACLARARFQTSDRAKDSNSSWDPPDQRVASGAIRFTLDAVAFALWRCRFRMVGTYVSVIR